MFQLQISIVNKYLVLFCVRLLELWYFDMLLDLKLTCLGVVCWEVLNRREPYPDMDAYMASVRVLTKGFHPSLPDSKMFPVVSKMMKRCFSYKPTDRPTFEEICKLLQTEREEFLESEVSANENLQNI